MTTAIHPKTKFDDLFIKEGLNGQDAYFQAIDQTKKLISDVSAQTRGPFCGETPQMIQRAVKEMKLAAEKGQPLETVLEDVETLLLHGIQVNHKACIGHLHCPPLIPALAAEMVISAANQSLDSWDQSSSATYLEQELINWICSRLGLGNTADGTFTSGGTQSNYMGLLLARDSFCQQQWNWNVQKKGLPPEASRLRILCSEAAHFTVKKSASQLGLGEDAVIQVSTDCHQRMSLGDLKEKLRILKADNLLPFALVGTCGTTDFGSIDPLDQMAEAAKENSLWFHVDAAYGGALMLSHNDVHRLKGIERADSITADFHKLFFQPISCGAFLLKDRRHFQHISYHADYLNPEQDDEEGLIHLVNKSVQTTRRFDALKLFMSLRTVGLERFGDMIDHTIQVARETAQLMQESRLFTVINGEPELNAVVFRYEPPFLKNNCDAFNKQIHSELLHGGRVLLAKTVYEGELYLKFTLLNPRVTMEDMKKLIADIVELGDNIHRREGKPS
ncbi:pyridoxal phosphate-dependent decarboxylase family protein [Fictibacillus fluitans]|uniref:Aspartate aminotransferase family protein n=1 Tax=Fictibacillus fluitans TaxID=3058422 RepID=A0ABT8I3I2_9BACL|nr:aspartate aminotransferase family protein [Fictibacillus sp. NE201]MDN4527539.1 aspartate aminotransferase family protein [Fictibacillus sp. NE201]